MDVLSRPTVHTLRYGISKVAHALVLIKVHANSLSYGTILLAVVNALLVRVVRSAIAIIIVSPVPLDM